MRDYWKELKLNECWSERERYNYIMNLVLKDNAPTGTVDEPLIDEEIEETGNLNVNVKNTDEDGLNGCTVTIKDDENEYTGTTDSNGTCTIQNIPIGEYQATTKLTGYIDYTETITITVDENVLNITLTEEDGE